MTRETKLGLLITCSFFCLLGVVLYTKVKGPAHHEATPYAQADGSAPVAPDEPKEVTPDKVPPGLEPLKVSPVLKRAPGSGIQQVAAQGLPALPDLAPTPTPSAAVPSGAASTTTPRSQALPTAKPASSSKTETGGWNIPEFGGATTPVAKLPPASEVKPPVVTPPAPATPKTDPTAAPTPAPSAAAGGSPPPAAPGGTSGGLTPPPPPPPVVPPSEGTPPAPTPATPATLLEPTSSGTSATAVPATPTPTAPPPAADVKSPTGTPLPSSAPPADKPLPGTPAPPPASPELKPVAGSPMPPLGQQATAEAPPIHVGIPTGGQGPISTPSNPNVDSYDEETYLWQAGDTMDKVSKAKYFKDKYWQALLLFNRNHPRGAESLRQDPPTLQPGQPVYIPPLRILLTKYGSVIPQDPNEAAIPAPTPPPPPTGSGAPPPAAPTADGPSASVGSPAPAAPAPTGKEPIYRVHKDGGELVGEIARRTLGTTNRWPDIYKLNPKIDPMYPLPPGSVLRLPADAQVPPENAQ